MKHKFLFTFVSLICCMVWGNQRTMACSCGPPPTVQDTFDWADVVVIAKAVSLGKKIERAGQRDTHDSFETIKMEVEKVYKGSLKPNDEMVFYAGGGACGWSFDEQDIGKQYLFYLKDDTKVWYVGMCGRSNNLKYANDDLLYLDNLAKVRGKTRISGTIRFDQKLDSDVEGIKIQVIGTKKTYKVETDKNGIYEIYDLPAGKYWIKPEIPSGWKVGEYVMTQSRSYAGQRKDEYNRQTGIPIILHAKNHAEMNIDFEIDNAFRGKVVDPNGIPMRGVCLQAVPIESKDSRGGKLDCTDDDGNFSIERLSPGIYLLVANDEGKLSSSEPFKTLFYPGVSERESAVPLKIDIGEFRENLYFQVPKIEDLIVIEGLFLYADDKPVVGEFVTFTATNEKKNIEGKANIKTDSQGRFSLKVLKGLQGQLVGSMYVYSSRFENCAEVEKLIRASGKDFLETNTQIIEIKAENNLSGVILRFPFPSCKKAKR